MDERPTMKAPNNALTGEKSDISEMLNDSIPALGTKKTLNTNRIGGFLLGVTKVCQQTVPEYPFKLARLIHHRYNMNKRWYVEFYAWDVSLNEIRRYRMFEPLNREKNKQRRIELAHDLIRTINAQLAAGKVLGKEKLAENIVATVNPAKLSLLQAINYVKAQKEANKHRKSYVRSFKTLSTNIEEWLEHKKIPDFYVSKLDETDVRDFFQYLRDEKKLSNKSINGLVTNLGIVLRFIEKNSDKVIWKKDPLRNFALLPVVSKMHAAYSDAQIKIIKEEIVRTQEKARLKYRPVYDQLQLFISFVYYLFIRPNENYQIRISDIQIESNRVFVKGEVSKNKMDDMVEIAPQLKNAIINSGILNYPHHFYVFGQWGMPSEKQLNSNAIWDTHKEILKRTGLLKVNENFSLYSYKHSGVVKMYQATKDIKLIQRMCRHQTLEQTNAYLRDLGLLTEYDQLQNYKGAV